MQAMAHKTGVPDSTYVTAFKVLCHGGSEETLSWTWCEGKLSFLFLFLFFRVLEINVQQVHKLLRHTGWALNPRVLVVYVEQSQPVY